MEIVDDIADGWISAREVAESGDRRIVSVQSILRPPHSRERFQMAPPVLARKSDCDMQKIEPVGYGEHCYATFFLDMHDFMLEATCHTAP